MSQAGEGDALPPGWAEKPLLTLLSSLETGKRPRGGVRGITEGVPSLGGEHLAADGGFDFSRLRFVPEEFAATMKRGHLAPGDVLIVKDGATTGKTALVGEDFPFPNAVVNEHLFVCRPGAEVSSRFLAAFLRSPDGQRRILAHFQGAAQGGINREFATGTMVPVPPPAEQRRITDHLAEVERAYLDGRARLAACRVALEHLQGALLAAACAGRMTEDWRARNPDATSVREELEGVAPRARRRRSEATIDLDLPELPEHYVLTTLGAAADLLQYGTSKRCDASPDRGIPVLRMGNIQRGRLDLESLKYCDAGAELDQLILADGDLLFNRTNSPELVGKSAVFRGTERTSFASYLIRVRLHPQIADPDFVNFWINSPTGRRWSRLVKSDGVSQSNINGTKLASLPLPLPPLAEQEEIVRRATAGLTAAESLLGTCDRTGRTLDQVFRSAMASAFRGELSPLAATD